jgi:hypothetical protein
MSSVAIQLSQASKWEIVCPRCNTVAMSHENNSGCPNCRATIHLYTPIMPQGGRWESADAYYSWVQLKCDKGCGWWTNQVTCKSCGATIQGKFFKRKDTTQRILIALAIVGGLGFLSCICTILCAITTSFSR